jgi:hypothetical protein
MPYVILMSKNFKDEKKPLQDEEVDFELTNDIEVDEDTGYDWCWNTEERALEVLSRIAKNDFDSNVESELDNKYVVCKLIPTKFITTEFKMELKVKNIK